MILLKGDVLVLGPNSNFPTVNEDYDEGTLHVNNPQDVGGDWSHTQIPYIMSKWGDYGGLFDTVVANMSNPILYEIAEWVLRPNGRIITVEDLG